MAELANCARCDAVFVKNIRDICPNCFKKEETAFDTVYRYLRDQKNREATLKEIVEATGVEEILIIKFVKENRLRTAQFPNLAYPCKKCGNHINAGEICKDCADELQKDLLNHQKQLQKSKRNETKKLNTYYTLGQNKND